MKSTDAVDPEDFRPLPEAIRTAKSLSEEFVRTWREALYETETANELVDFISVEGPNGERTSVPLFDNPETCARRGRALPLLPARHGEISVYRVEIRRHVPICSLNEFFGSEKDAQDYKTVEKSAPPSTNRMVRAVQVLVPTGGGAGPGSSKRKTGRDGAFRSEPYLGQEQPVPSMGHILNFSLVRRQGLPEAFTG